MFTKATILNHTKKAIDVGEFTFEPGEPTTIQVETNSNLFRVIRTTKGLKIIPENQKG